MGAPSFGAKTIPRQKIMSCLLKAKFAKKWGARQFFKQETVISAAKQECIVERNYLLNLLHILRGRAYFLINHFLIRKTSKKDTSILH